MKLKVVTGPFRLSLRFRLIDRYWQTLRHLRPVQFYGRLWFRFYRPRPARPERLTLALRNPNQGQTTFSLALNERKRESPFPLLRPVSLLSPSRFRFLNQTHDASGPEAWNDLGRDKLWLYNLHYFDDLNAQDAPARADWHRALIDRWIAENPPGRGNGWEPYPTSLRIVNWVKWLLREGSIPASRPPVIPAPQPPVIPAPQPSVIPAGKPESRPGTGNLAASTKAQQPNTAILNSLATQAHWLRHRLEHHLLGNHLFANAKALIFAGAFFVGPEAERWLRQGQRLLRRELNEQILPDGCHFERSPMYHAILLEDVLDILNLAGVYPGVLDASLLALCRAKAVAMLDWLAAMTHPDGEISFFNDAAFGIAPTLAELERYAQAISTDIPAGRPESRPGTGNLVASTEAQQSNASSPFMAPLWLRDSGYIRLHAGPAIALLDVAPIGPDYLPGHAHADTLSFELSLFGQRLIVNGGTSGYGSGRERLAERGTAAHSTVQIDGADSSEVWGGFRVARRAQPFDVVVSDPIERSCTLTTHPKEKSGLSPLLVSAAHDGYRRLPGQPVHRRTWRLTDTGLSVIDIIEGDYREAITRFHLHPAVQVEMGRLSLPLGQSVAWRVTDGYARIIPNHWHPQFGMNKSSHTIEVRLSERQCCFELSW